MPKRSVGEYVGVTLQAVTSHTIHIPNKNFITHLQFRRFVGCPMCNLHIREFVKRHDEIVAAGIQEVAVFNSSFSQMQAYQNDTPFDLIADPKRQLYQQFGVDKAWHAAFHPQAMVAGVKGLFKHGMQLPEQTSAVMELPADFLIDQFGIIKAVKYGENAYDQWSVDELLALAAQIK